MAPPRTSATDLRHIKKYVAEMFPNVCPKWIEKNAKIGRERLIDFILTNMDTDFVKKLNVENGPDDARPAPREAPRAPLPEVPIVPPRQDLQPAAPQRQPQPVPKAVEAGDAQREPALPEVPQVTASPRAQQLPATPAVPTVPLRAKTPPRPETPPRADIPPTIVPPGQHLQPAAPHRQPQPVRVADPVPKAAEAGVARDPALPKASQVTAAPRPQQLPATPAVPTVPLRAETPPRADNPPRPADPPGPADPPTAADPTRPADLPRAPLPKVPIVSPGQALQPVAPQRQLLQPVRAAVPVPEAAEAGVAPRDALPALPKASQVTAAPRAQQGPVFPPRAICGLLRKPLVKTAPVEVRLSPTVNIPAKAPLEPAPAQLEQPPTVTRPANVLPGKRAPAQLQLLPAFIRHAEAPVESAPAQLQQPSTVTRPAKVLPGKRAPAQFQFLPAFIRPAKAPVESAPAQLEQPPTVPRPAKVLPVKRVRTQAQRLPLPVDFHYSDSEDEQDHAQEVIQVEKRVNQRVAIRQRLADRQRPADPPRPAEAPPVEHAPAPTEPVPPVIEDSSDTEEEQEDEETSINIVTELFPNVCHQWIVENIHMGREPLIEYILENIDTDEVKKVTRKRVHVEDPSSSSICLPKKSKPMFSEESGIDFEMLKETSEGRQKVIDMINYLLDYCRNCNEKPAANNYSNGVSRDLCSRYYLTRAAVVRWLFRVGKKLSLNKIKIPRYPDKVVIIILELLYITVEGFSKDEMIAEFLPSHRDPQCNAFRKYESAYPTWENNLNRRRYHDALEEVHRMMVEFLRGSLAFQCSVCDEDVYENEEQVTCQTIDTKDSKAHTYCKHCVTGHAKTCAQDGRVLKNGAGIPCMERGCTRHFTLSNIAPFLDSAVMKILDQKVQQAVLLTSKIQVERCKFCNYAAEMGNSKEINKVFDCLQCRAMFCRYCLKDWDLHIGKRCDELETEQEKARKKIEEELSNAVIHNCTRCKLYFQKENGCNRMTCTCGMTQCYVCRKPNINYKHFCQHMRDPKKPGVCPEKCPQKCLLFENVQKKMETKKQEIVTKAKEELGEEAANKLA